MLGKKRQKKKPHALGLWGLRNTRTCKLFGFTGLCEILGRHEVTDWSFDVCTSSMKIYYGVVFVNDEHRVVTRGTLDHQPKRLWECFKWFCHYKSAFTYPSGRNQFSAVAFPHICTTFGMWQCTCTCSSCLTLSLYLCAPPITPCAAAWVTAKCLPRKFFMNVDGETSWFSLHVRMWKAVYRSRRWLLGLLDTCMQTIFENSEIYFIAWKRGWRKQAGRRKQEGEIFSA